MAGIFVGAICADSNWLYNGLRHIAAYNFAHGDLFMAAGLIMIYLTASLPLYVAIPLDLIIIAVVGFLIERVAYKPLRNAPRMSIMISAIGVSYLLQNVALYVTGGLAKTYPTIPWISNSVTIFGATTKVVTLVTPVLTLILVVALVLLINNTKIGMAMGRFPGF